jgi:hypothetical protein
MIVNRMKELRRVLAQEIIALLKEGKLTIEEIGREVGCTTATVVNTQKKHGLLRRDVKKNVLAIHTEIREN